MSSLNPEDRGSTFTADGVEEYERRRYGGIDQRIVHAREVRLIGKMFDVTEKEEARGGVRRVLDMPCGYGRFTDILRGRGFEVTNADLSLEMVRRAAETKSVSGVVADAKQGLPFTDGTFDAVFSIRFLHHVHDPQERSAVLGEFARASSRWIIVSFYRAGGVHGLQRKLRRLFKKSGTRIKMIEPGRFEAEAAAAGCRIVRIAPLLRGIHAYHLALLRRESPLALRSEKE
jgi:SAM-dependent methyltransferase